MNSHRSLIAAGLGFGVLLVAAGTFGVVQSGSSDDARLPDPRAAAAQSGALASASGATLDVVIADLAVRVDEVPTDHVAWASLGLAYVQQARVTANGDLYELADEALETSLDINDSDNFLAYAGHAALSSAKHDFVSAREYALEGLEINEFSAILWGALSDAELQLGRFPDARAAVQEMLDLSPDTSSFARASYLRELRGDIAGATRLDATSARRLTDPSRPFVRAACISATSRSMPATPRRRSTTTAPRSTPSPTVPRHSPARRAPKPRSGTPTLRSRSYEELTAPWPRAVLPPPVRGAARVDRTLRRSRRAVPPLRTTGE